RNRELAVQRQIRKEYKLRICMKDGIISRQICWLKLNRALETTPAPDIDLYCGLSNLNEKYSYHSSGRFHKKETDLKVQDNLGETAGLLLMHATWKRQCLNQIGSQQPVLTFGLLLDKETLETFPEFTTKKKYDDVIEIDPDTFSEKESMVMVDIKVSKKDNFSDPLPKEPGFRKIIEIENVWLIIDVKEFSHD
ncbi:MAG: hypothetical protein ACE5IA_00560, partial [Dehalococcoidia bacterium]